VCCSAYEATLKNVIGVDTLPTHANLKCNTLQHTATHCHTLQHTAIHLQYTATHQVTLQDVIGADTLPAHANLNSIHGGFLGILCGCSYLEECRDTHEMSSVGAGTLVGSNLNSSTSNGAAHLPPPTTTASGDIQIAEYLNVLQCVVKCCSVLQSVAVHCV